MRSLDISNGENIGVSMFVQGCHFHCKNCFNSETWDFNGGKEWTKNTKEKFIDLINRSYIKRVSILGGEPLAKENINDIYNLLEEIREKLPQKTIWLYTGYDFDQLQKQFNIYKYTPFANEADEWLTRWEIVSSVDIIVDGGYIDEQKDLTLKWRGSKNQRVIDIKKSLDQNKTVLYCD